MNTVLIDVQNIPEPEWLVGLETYVLQVLEKLNRHDWEVSLLLCDDATIADFNQSYRNKAGPTDVLSFPQVEDAAEIPSQGPFLAGDIIISLDSARSNAEYFEVDLDQEFKRLVIHGLLHLSGMDHASNQASEPMLQLQERLLAENPGELMFRS